MATCAAAVLDGAGLEDNLQAYLLGDAGHHWHTRNGDLPISEVDRRRGTPGRSGGPAGGPAGGVRGARSTPNLKVANAIALPEEMGREQSSSRAEYGIVAASRRTRCPTAGPEE